VEITQRVAAEKQKQKKALDPPLTTTKRGWAAGETGQQGGADGQAPSSHHHL
jgi:hypothetical protein